MANTIKLKRGSGSDPSASDLVVGELALRTDTGKIFLKKDNGNVTEVSGGGGLSDGDKGDIVVSNSGDILTIDDDAITTGKISAGAVNDGKLASNAVTNVKVASNAAISLSKLEVIASNKIVGNDSGNAVPKELTPAEVRTIINVEDGATADQTASEIKTLLNSSGLVNAQIDASAAIAGTKISPDFGSQNIVTTGAVDTVGITIGGNTPSLNFNDANDNPDFRFLVNSNSFILEDTTNSANRFVVNSDGHIDITGNLDVGAGIDVTGGITYTTTSIASGTLEFADTLASYDPTVGSTGSDTSTITAISLGFGQQIGVNASGYIRNLFKINSNSGRNIEIGSANTNYIGDILLLPGLNHSVRLKYNGSDRLVTDSTGVDVNGALDVTGLITTTDLKIGDVSPILVFLDTNADADNQKWDFKCNTGNEFVIQGINDAGSGGGNLFKITRSSNNLSTFEAQKSGVTWFTVDNVNRKVTTRDLDVTNNITVTGTVDGVDIAARNTLFGGLTSSSGVLTNGVTATTQSASDNSTKVATTAYTDTAISNLVSSAPSTLDTLNELAAALGDDANFSTTVTNSIATKLPLAGGTMTGDLTITRPVSTNNTLTLGGSGAYSSFLKLFCGGAGGGLIEVSGRSDGGNVLNFRVGSSTIATLNESGNLTVNGTVDGRDVATDGTKLDGIESSATADQTASEIVALIADQTIAPSAIDMEDDERIKLGASDDLQIYHSGSDSWVRDLNQGNLYLDTNGAKISLISDGNQSTGSMAHFNKDGSVQLFHNNVERFTSTSTGATITGNLAVTGLVDGRDVATDGTKLDGIEASATADQTASEILTLIKTVDGSGSNLDADTLDGQQGSYYADAASYVKEIRTKSDITTRFDSGFYETASATTAEGWPVTTNNWYHLIASTHSNTGNYYSMQIAGNFFSQSEFYIRSTHASGTRAWSEIWTSSSDGAGSGLDADTLDGVQGSSFVRSDATDTLNGQYTISTSADEKLILAGSTNPYIRFQEGTTNKAYIQWNGSELILVNTESSDYLRIGSGLNGLKYEVDGISATVWHLGNDGSGSGLDADTLDGVNGANYVRTDQNTTITSDLYIGGGAGGITVNGGSDIQFTNGDWTGNTTAAKIQLHSNYLYIAGGSNGIIFRENATNRWQIEGSGHFRPETDSTYDIGTSSIRVRNGYFDTLYGDGSNVTNVNATTLDSIDSGSFLRSDANDTYSANLTFSQDGANGFLTTAGGTTFHNVGGSSSKKLVLRNLAELRFQDGADWNYNEWAGIKFVTSTDTMYIGGAASSNFTNNGGAPNIDVNFVGLNASGLKKDGNTVWHAGNDGSGSGLDADTLDGVQGASFLRSDADDSLSAIITGHSSNTEVIRLNSASYSSSLYLGGWNSTNSNNIARIRASSNLHIDSPANGNLYLNWYASNKSIFLGNAGQGIYAGGSNVVFHAGNDGAGSGLDADTLDGVQGSSFVQTNTDVQFGSHCGLATTVGGTPASRSAFLALGDNDTGVAQNGDGQLELWANNQEIMNLDTDEIECYKHLRPNGSQDLGSSSARWQNLYVNDMHFSNEGKTNDVDGSWGDWTLQEGESDIFMINNRSGKKFKIAMIPV